MNVSGTECVLSTTGDVAGGELGGGTAKRVEVRFGDVLAEQIAVTDEGVQVTPVCRIPDEMIAKLRQVWMDQFKVPADPAQADNHPSNTYATVDVDGKVVATIGNSGCVSTSNQAYGRIADLPSMGSGERLTGPALAQKRAQEIAERLGGTVKMAATVKTQYEWESREPVRFTYDYAAMREALAKFPSDARPAWLAGIPGTAG